MKHPKNQTKSFKKSVMNALHFFFHFKQQKSTYRRGFFSQTHAFFGMRQLETVGDALAA